MLPNVETNLTATMAGTPLKRPEPEITLTVSDAGNRNAADKSVQDSVEISFYLSREERAVFAEAFANGKNPADMTEKEKSVLQQASERISKYIDEAIAKNSENRDRTEKAVREWYSGIVKGDDKKPVDMLQILRRAAIGQLDA